MALDDDDETIIKRWLLEYNLIAMLIKQLQCYDIRGGLDRLFR